MLKIKKIAQENNITLNLKPIQYLNPIASLVPEISSRVVKFIKKEIILDHKIGAKIITMQGGEKDKPKRKDLVAKNLKTMIKNLKEIAKFGKKYKIKIGLENSFSPEKLCRTFQNLLMIVGLVKDNIDFKKFLKEAKKYNYSSPFILEVFSYRGLLKSREKILKIWNKI